MKMLLLNCKRCVGISSGFDAVPSCRLLSLLCAVVPGSRDVPGPRDVPEPRDVPGPRDVHVPRRHGCVLLYCAPASLMYTCTPVIYQAALRCTVHRLPLLFTSNWISK